MNCFCKKFNRKGFSLLELLVSSIVLLVILTAVFSLFTRAVKVNKSELAVSDTDQQVKNALNLISTEIERSGSNPDPGVIALSGFTGLTATNPNTTNMTIDVNNTSGINVGNTLRYGTNNLVVTRVTRNSNYPATLSGTVKVTGTLPSSGTVLKGKNYPNSGAIMYDLAGSGTASWSSNSTTLRLFGDLNQNGAFYYSEYKYDSANLRITRASELVTGTVPSSGSTTFKVPYTLLDNVTACNFKYIKDSIGNVISVLMTITVRPPNDMYIAANRPTFTYRLTITSRNVAAISAIKRSGELAGAFIPSSIPPQEVRNIASY